MFEEFKKFAIQGSALDLAVGMVIGAAFGKIVSSLVEDILLPPLGLLLGKVDFANLFLSLSGGTYASVATSKAAGAATLNYGIFLTTILNFLLVTGAMFLLMKPLNRLKAMPLPPGPPTTKDCPYCWAPIPLPATRCGHCTSEVP